MERFKVIKDKNFSIISNIVIFSKLTNRARGLMCVLLALSDDWHININGLAKICNCGRAEIISEIKELEEHKYVKKEKTRDEKGHFVTNYIIYEKPYDVEKDNETDKKEDLINKDQGGIPESGKPTRANGLGQTESGKPILLSTNEQVLNNQKSNNQCKKEDNNSIHFNSINEEEKEKNEETYQIFIKNINADGLYIKSNCELRTSEEKKICKGFVEFCEDVIKSSENREFLINSTKYLKKDVLDKIMKLDFDDFLFLVECYKNNNTEIINNNQYMLKMIWTCKMNNNTQFSNRVKIWKNKKEEERKEKEKVFESLVSKSSFDDNRYLYVVDGWEVMPHPMEFDISDNNCFIQEKMAVYNDKPEKERKELFNAYKKFKKEYPFTKIYEIDYENDTYFIKFNDNKVYLKDSEKELVNV